MKHKKAKIFWFNKKQHHILELKKSDLKKIIGENIIRKKMLNTSDSRALRNEKGQVIFFWKKASLSKLHVVLFCPTEPRSFWTELVQFWVLVNVFAFFLWSSFFGFLVAFVFFCFFLEIRAILLLFVCFLLLYAFAFLFGCLLPCLTIVKFVRCR